MQTIHVTKASGELEPYDESKLRASLRNAGADNEIIDRIARAVHEILHEGISTQKVYNEAFRLLKQHSNRSAGRYKLKQALLELGPSGYPFEKFTAELLNRLGYRTTVGEIIEGKCVSHEIDVVAEKGESFYIVECKFHNRKNHTCNVQVPLYIQSRFVDVKRKWGQLPGHMGKKHYGWIVTNTRFTEDARDYANCMGLRLMSWDYPEGEGLKDLVEQVNLHPVTCLSSLSNSLKKVLLEQDIVFCQQVAESEEALRAAGLDQRKSNNVRREAKAICAFNNHGS